ncbi:type VII toxin-antitoxin system HepT family RNase toxin [Nitrospira sp. Kam-Ns4a]
MASKFELVPGDIQDRLNELPACLDALEGLAAVWLFGSMARGEATPVSDVDVAYLPAPALTDEEVERVDARFYGCLTNALHTDELTLINLRTAPALVVWNVLHEGRLLVCRNPAALGPVAEACFQVAPDIAWLRWTGNEDFLRGMRMTPPKQVDTQRVTELLRLISDDVRVLRQKASATKEHYLASSDLQAIVERRLQTAAEECINVGNHLIARLGFRAPQDYADVFRVLGAAGVLPHELSQVLMELARLRTLLVHVYWAIDHERLYDTLPARLATLELFIDTIVRWLTKQPD